MHHLDGSGARGAGPAPHRQLLASVRQFWATFEPGENMVLVEGSLMRGKPLCITHRLRVLCVIGETPACLPLPAPLVERASFGLVLPPLAFFPPRGARPAGGRGGIFAK
jgi:hypothetical protein